MENDLISREALKKEIENLIGYSLSYEAILNAIDNAPTVDLKDIYQEGHYDGHLEGYTKAINEERPQGEWEESHIFSCGKILKMQLDVIEHKCKNCGRWSIKWVGTIPDNFCSNCGAGMRGKENVKT